MTNSVFIDANVLIYAREKNAPLSKEAVILLESLLIEDTAGLITPYVVNEIHYLYLKHYGASISQAYCKEILETQNIELVDLHGASPLLLKEVARQSVLLYEKEPLEFAQFRIAAFKKYMEAKRLLDLRAASLEKFISKT